MAVVSNIPTLNLKKISLSVYNSKRQIKISNQIIFNRTKQIKEDISTKNRLFVENSTYIRRREEIDERNKQEDALEAPDIVENQPDRVQELTTHSNEGLFGRILSFAGYLSAGWVLTRLPELIEIGNGFLYRLNLTKNILGNFFNSTILSFQSFGNLLGGILTNVSRLDLMGVYNSIQTNFGQLLTNIGKMGDSLYDGFSLITDPLGIKLYERSQLESEMQRLQDAYATEESSPSGSVFESPIVTTEGIPSEGKALLDAIAGSEAGAAGYKSRFPSKSFSSFADHPRISEPISWRPGYTSDAAGRYQFLSTTWDQYKPAKEFTPENQDIAAWRLAIAAYGKGESGIVQDLRKNPLIVANKLSRTWTSLPGGSEPNAATSGFVSRFRSSVGRYNSAGVSSVNFSSQEVVTNIVSVNTSDTGSGYTIRGVNDAQGRPAVFSRAAAEAFYKMMKDSGGIVKGSDIASSQRSPQKNRSVGGASGSKHLTGTAIDIHGSSGRWIRQNGSKYGWFANDYSGSHGGHFEFKSTLPQRPQPRPPAQITSTEKQSVYERISTERRGENYLVLDQRTPKMGRYGQGSYRRSREFVVSEDLILEFNNNIKKRLLTDLSFV
jgi:muramidase (phage lysozyme)